MCVEYGLFREENLAERIFYFGYSFFRFIWAVIDSHLKLSLGFQFVSVFFLLILFYFPSWFLFMCFADIYLSGICAASSFLKAKQKKVEQ